MLKENQTVPSKALIIKSPHVDKILSGEKTWEIRGTNTNTRGIIALVKSGANQIVGVCQLVDVLGPLTLRDLQENIQFHCDENDTLELPYKNTYAWVINSAEIFDPPIHFKNPPGAVIWTALPDEIIKKIEGRRVYQAANDSTRRNFLESLASDLRFVGHQVNIRDTQLSTEFEFLPKVFDSDEIAEIYKKLRDRDLQYERDFILKMEKKNVIEDYFIDGKDLDIDNIRPEIRICRNQKERDLHRYCRQLQSVPNSPGVGRRFSALVYDIGQKKPVIMGIIGLAETAYYLRARDNFLSWVNIDSRIREREIREIGLRRLKQLSICLAISPYNQLFGAKLIAQLALSDPIQSYHQTKYKEPLLGLVTTSATQEQHSPIFNRIHLSKLPDSHRYQRPQPSQLYLHIGKTLPYTTLMISKETVDLARELIINNSIKGALFGESKIRSNLSKGRVIAKAMSLCGLNQHILKLNSKVLYFGYLHENNKRLLSDFNSPVSPMVSLDVDHVVDYWKSNWVEKAKNDKHRLDVLRRFERRQLLLSSQIEIQI